MLLSGVECVIFTHVFECFFSFRRAWGGFAIVDLAAFTVLRKVFLVAHTGYGFGGHTLQNSHFLGNKLSLIEKALLTDRGIPISRTYIFR